MNVVPLFYSIKLVYVHKYTICSKRMSSQILPPKLYESKSSHSPLNLLGGRSATGLLSKQLLTRLEKYVSFDADEAYRLQTPQLE